VGDSLQEMSEIESDLGGLNLERPTVDTEILQEQMRQLARQRRGLPPMQPEPPKPELPQKTIQPPKIDPLFSDMDGVMKNMYYYIPNVSSELLYVSEISNDIKIFLFFMFLGALLIIVPVIYSI
jgi:hypothetical protein